jgi:hypothetical protein
LRQTGSTAGLVPFSKRSSSAALAHHPVLQEGLTNAHAIRVEVDSLAGTGQETQRSASEHAHDYLPRRAGTSAALLSLDRRVCARIDSTG